MKYTENSLNILTAKSYKGIGNAWIVKNLKGNESVDTIVTLLNKTIKGEQTDVDEFERLKRDFENKLVAKFENCCDGFVALGDKISHNTEELLRKAKSQYFYSIKEILIC
jgi:DNA processing protein